MQGTWHKSGCLLCAQNCGLELLVEDNRIVRVRGDRQNPRSKGYVCSKGVKIAHFQHHSGRLRHPLKRTASGFERIGWDQALDEIARRLRAILDEHGPRALAYVGGGGQGSHIEAAFGLTLLRALGSQYHYSPLGQELTGYFWVCGRMIGRQNRYLIPDEAGAEMLVAIGWNGMVSHQMPRAPLALRELARHPDKRLVVIDPRRSETARLADVHLALRPGTDALLTRAMIALILERGWEHRGYLAEHTAGFERIEPWFRSFDVDAALAVCGLEREPVLSVCKELATRRWCTHADLGTLMGRHSTATSYLQLLLLAICGRIGVPGGNVVPGALVPIGTNSDERDGKAWRTVQSGFPAILGVYPPNVMPEEILADHPDRLRAVIVSNANPLRSYADTSAHERAFARLDLSVTIDIAMSETAQRSDYVLPARSGLESWDATFFAWTFPEVYFQMRRPVLEPEGEPLEAGEIHTRLAERLGLLPDIPGWLRRAAELGRLPFTLALLPYLALRPRAVPSMPFVLAKTLGAAEGSVHKAALWGLALTASAEARRNAARVGLGASSPRTVLSSLLRSHGASLVHAIPRLSQAERLYQAILDHPEGLWVGKVDPGRNLDELRTPHGKIELFIPELEAEILATTAEAERAALELDPQLPLVLNAGRHMERNANTLMRDPAWLGDERGCTLAMHPTDAAERGLADGELARVTTAAGELLVEVELTEDTRPGMVLLPHGFGLVHDGAEIGANANRLTHGTHRDPIAATPLHRYIPCRVDPAG